MIHADRDNRAMLFMLPTEILRDIDSAVRSAFAATAVVNVAELSVVVQKRNRGLNVALEDIEEQILRVAMQIGAGILFDSYEGAVPMKVRATARIS